MKVQGDLSIVFVVDLAKVLIGQLAEILVVDSTGAGEDHAGSLVVSFDVVHKVVPCDALDVFGGAQDSAAQGGALVGDGVEVVENDLLKVHLDLLHLAEDDASFPLNFLKIPYT